MRDFIGDLIVRAVPVAFPAFMLVALLVHWGVLPDGTEDKSKKESKETKDGNEGKKEAEKPKDEDGEK